MVEDREVVADAGHPRGRHVDGGLGLLPELRLTPHGEGVGPQPELGGRAATAISKLSDPPAWEYGSRPHSSTSSPIYAVTVCSPSSSEIATSIE
jgi:hypothetical protein